MEQEIDEVNKIIHVKCTKEEKKRMITELSAYLYDYQFNFLIEEASTQK